MTIITETKVCTKCEVQYPKSSDYFSIELKRGKPYMRANCKNCRERKKITPEKQRQYHVASKAKAKGISVEEYEKQFAYKHGTYKRGCWDEKNNKICSKCKKSFPHTLDYFYSSGMKRDKKVLRSLCKGCSNLDTYGYRKKNRKYMLEYGRAYYRKIMANTERANNYRGVISKWRYRNPSRVANYNLKKYGISSEEYNSMYQGQNGRCFICNKAPAGKRHLSKLFVDHDHKTGAVRNLLCHKCNWVLGAVNDNPEILETMIKYVNYHKEK